MLNGDLVKKLQLNLCIIYLDCIIVFAANLKKHLKRLRTVLEKLRAVGHKLKVNKCEFLKRKLVYLGHVLSEEEMEMDIKKTDPIKN